VISPVMEVDARYGDVSIDSISFFLFSLRCRGIALTHRRYIRGFCVLREWLFYTRIQLSFLVVLFLVCR